MRDPQAAVFNKRLRRIDRIHRRGGGFEASGTLGQSYYTNSRKPKTSIPRVLIYTAGIIFGAKTLLISNLGLDDYLGRVSNLEKGSLVEQAGAVLMRADPVTLKLVELLAPLFG